MGSKPRVIVCATAYHPFVGGAEIAIQEVAQRLSGRFDFFVLTARTARFLPRREQRPEATVIRLGFGTRFDKWLLPFLIPYYVISDLRLPKFASSANSGASPVGSQDIGFRPNLLLWGMDISQGSLGAAAVKLLLPRIPFVLTVQYGESPEHLRRGRGGWIRRGFRMMLGRADRVTAISSYLSGVVRAYGYCGPAAVIPNGVDVAKFQNPSPIQSGTKTQTKHVEANVFASTVQSNANEGKTIITVSRLVPKNGVDILIDAIAEVKKEIPNVRCVIIGDGPERANLESRITKFGLYNSVRIQGAIPHEEIRSRLHAADIFVRPSRSEGMGIAFVEAMASGLPVVGTAVGGIPDVIEHVKTGLLARPDDARDLARQIIRLMRDPARAQEMADAGRKKAARDFDWDVIARAYGETFAEELSVKKRVMIATGLFPPEIGGPATYSMLLVDCLPQRGIGIRVVPFRWVRHLPRAARHLVYFLRVLSACRGSDVVFAQDPVSTGLPAMVAARVLRKKFLLKIVGDYAWEHFQIKNEKRKMKNGDAASPTVDEFQRRRYDVKTEIRRFIERLAARRAHAIIVPSEYLKSIVMQWGVPQERITVIYNAFETPLAFPSKEETRMLLGVSPNAFQIVSVGRLVPWKGFEALIRAMAIVREEIPAARPVRDFISNGARLTIIGSGPQEAALRRVIAKEHMAGVVFLAGALPHDLVLRHLRAADLFILNSSYEGFSHTLLEAMAMEVPVMASDAGGNSEIITDGATGRLYPRCDARKVAEEILHLYRRPEDRERFARAGRAALGRFSTEIMLASTAALLWKSDFNSVSSPMEVGLP